MITIGGKTRVRLRRHKELGKPLRILLRERDAWGNAKVEVVFPPLCEEHLGGARKVAREWRREKGEEKKKGADYFALRAREIGGTAAAIWVCHHGGMRGIEEIRNTT